MAYWETRNTPEEEGLARQLLPWGKCEVCGTATQSRLMERESGVLTGAFWFICGAHLGIPEID